MKTLMNFVFGAILAAVLIAPVAWANTQNLASKAVAMHNVVTTPDLWRPVVTVVRYALLPTP